MRVLGLDPGLATTGVAVIERARSGPRAVTIGAVRTTAGLPTEKRLAALGTKLAEILDKYRPEVAAVERLFFNVNVKTAMAVGQASGVALATSARLGVPVVHYTPLEVKQSVVGVGSATKNQVGAMVAALLGLGAPPKPPDAADACALAICHINRSGLRRAVEAAAR